MQEPRKIDEGGGGGNVYIFAFTETLKTVDFNRTE